MRLPLWAAVILLLAPPAAGQTTLQEQTREKSIRVSEVPQPARDAAQRELGAEPSRASALDGTQPQQYQLAGRNGLGGEVVVRVQADGTVLAKRVDVRR